MRNHLLVYIFVLVEIGYSQISPVTKTPEKPAERDLLQELSALSPCQKGCSNSLMDSIGLVIKSMSHIQRYDMICESYNQSYTCIELEKKCGNEDHSMFETLTSGFHYMCIDQQLAFKNTIHCIDAQSTQIQSECETDCNTKNTIMNLVLRSSIVQGIQSSILGASDVAADPFAFNPNAFNEVNQMTGELCTIGDCVLKCIKNKFNSRCEGSAGTLLTEVFVRPIAEAQIQMATIGPLLAMFLPQSCSYLHDEKELRDRYRIDPTMDDELRRMYSQKEAEKNKPKPPTKLPPVPNVKPSGAAKPVLPNVQIPSPLNSPVNGPSPNVRAPSAPSKPSTSQAKTPSPPINQQQNLSPKNPSPPIKGPSNLPPHNNQQNVVRTPFDGLTDSFTQLNLRVPSDLAQVTIPSIESKSPVHIFSGHNNEPTNMHVDNRIPAPAGPPQLLSSAKVQTVPLPSVPFSADGSSDSFAQLNLRIPSNAHVIIANPNSSPKNLANRVPQSNEKAATLTLPTSFTPQPRVTESP